MAIRQLTKDEQELNRLCAVQDKWYAMKREFYDRNKIPVTTPNMDRNRADVHYIMDWKDYPGVFEFFEMRIRVLRGIIAPIRRKVNRYRRKLQIDNQERLDDVPGVDDIFYNIT